MFPIHAVEKCISQIKMDKNQQSIILGNFQDEIRLKVMQQMKTDKKIPTPMLGRSFALVGKIGSSTASLQVQQRCCDTYLQTYKRIRTSEQKHGWILFSS